MIIQRCPKCGASSEGCHWYTKWGMWLQTAGDALGGHYTQWQGGDEALRVTCPGCDFEMLTPVLDAQEQE